MSAVRTFDPRQQFRPLTEREACFRSKQPLANPGTQISRRACGYCGCGCGNHVRSTLTYVHQDTQTRWPARTSIQCLICERTCLIFPHEPPREYQLTPEAKGLILGD